MSQRVRTWTDQRHFSPQHVQKLWQFVNAGGAKQLANSGHARIIASGLRDDITIFLRRHGTKLEHYKLATVKSLSVLQKKDRAVPVEFDRQRGKRHEGS